MILDSVRSWGTDNGYSWFNLGGGVRSNEDSLLEFKRGFSKNLFDFKLATLVTDRRLYSGLCLARIDYETRNGLQRYLTIISAEVPIARRQRQQRRPVAYCAPVQYRRRLRRLNHSTDATC